MELMPYPKSESHQGTSWTAVSMLKSCFIPWFYANSACFVCETPIFSGKNNDFWLYNIPTIVFMHIYISLYIYIHVWYVHTCMIHTYIIQYMPCHAMPYYNITLHCIALHCIALHCIPLHYTALHCIALHYIA